MRQPVVELRLGDGTLVRKIRLPENEEFLFCLLTRRYYDRRSRGVFVERNWDHHQTRMSEKIAAKSTDPLDVPRAASGLPLNERAGQIDCQF